MIGREELERELLEFAARYTGYGNGETPTRPFSDFGLDLNTVMAEGANFARTRLGQLGYVDMEQFEREVAVGFTIGLGTGLRLGRAAARRGQL